MLNNLLSYDAMFYYDKILEETKGNQYVLNLLDSLVNQIYEEFKKKNDFNEYQEFASKAIRHESENKNLIVGFALGLGGEAGEVLDDIKKREYHGRDIPIEHTAEELGDVLWYVANIASQIEYSLSEIVEENKNKLLTRYHKLYKEEHYE